jgi:hypothetical protein
MTGMILAGGFGIHILHNRPGGNFAKVSGTRDSRCIVRSSLECTPLKQSNHFSLKVDTSLLAGKGKHNMRS